MKSKSRDCIKIGNSQGFIIPKDDKGFPELGKKYDLIITETKGDVL